MADTENSGLNREALDKAIKALLIKDLAIRRATLEVEPDFVLGIGKMELQVQLKWRTKEARVVEIKNNQTQKDERVFLVEIETLVRLVDPPADGTEAPPEVKPRAQLDTDFAAVYAVKDNIEVEPAALSEFASKNAIYHVWPYWREHLHAVFGKARLPLFTLPMFAFVPPPKDASVPATQPAPAGNE